MSNEQLILSGKICPYCGKKTELIDSSEIYHGTAYGWMYICRPCDAYVGCYNGTTRSLGRLANSELRALKKEAHDAFDKIWRNGMMCRTDAYSWLSEQIGTPLEVTHIGMFDVENCKKVIQISNEYLASKEMKRLEFASIKIKLVNNHIVIDDGQGLVLDTGSPLSFHQSGKIDVCGQIVDVPTHLPVVSCDYLCSNVGQDIRGLLGMDIISQHCTMVSVRDNLLFINDNASYYHHFIPYELQMGNLLAIRIKVNGIPARMIVDSGAPISYISEVYLKGLNSVGIAYDFSPYCGHFETNLYECETDTQIQGVKFQQRYGTPPPQIRMKLGQLHADGIVGVDLFKLFRLQLKDSRVFFPPQGI